MAGPDRDPGRGPRADGGPALKLIEAMLSPTEQGEIAEAKPYLQKISYVAVASEAKDEVTTAKLIVGVQ